MNGTVISNEWTGVKIRIEKWSDVRKKPVLAVERGNTITKYASFNNEHSAVEFAKILAEFIGIDMDAEVER